MLKNRLTAREIFTSMEVQTIAKIECSWCGMEYETEVDTSKSFMAVRASEDLAKDSHMVYAQDAHQIGLACRECLRAPDVKRLYPVKFVVQGAAADKGETPMYLSTDDSITGGEGWTFDPDRAMHFKTRKDAQEMMDKLFLDVCSIVKLEVNDAGE